METKEERKQRKKLKREKKREEQLLAEAEEFKNEQENKKIQAQIESEEKLLSKKKKRKTEETTSQGRQWTLSVALPGSILDNAQSIQLRSYLAGQIARALTIYNVDEIIIFDEESTSDKDLKNTSGDFQGIGRGEHCCVQLGRILQYLECPQYLRKFLFKKHKDLEFAGICNPLDATHHLREDMYFKYREGYVQNRPLYNSFMNLF